MKPQNRLNFSGGPGVLPESVLLQARDAMIEVPEVGLSVLGISHRSDWFACIVSELETLTCSLLGVPDNYRALFLQGGATQQFSMLPMLLLRGSAQPADYIHSGYWSGKAIPEARKEGPLRVIWSGESADVGGGPGGFHRLPSDDELDFSPDAPFIHYVSNETVEGVQFHRVLGLEDVPRICDMSSDFLSRPCEAERFDFIYAHAQKNIGPAGVTIVVMREELLERAPIAREAAGLPNFLDYRSQLDAHSNYNTPPVFAIYVTLLVTRWLANEIGGLANMERINQAKADCLYRAIDDSDGFYLGRAQVADRSLMNVAFNLATPALEQRFVAESTAAGFSGLKGHRAIGGIRASIYNAMTVEAVEELVGFMEGFQRRARG